MEKPPGRRVLVAVVPGQLGAHIQAWREKYDAKHAARLPPHLTVCYRPPDAPLASLEAQVRHGFPEPVQVRLGPVFVLAHREAPMAVQVLETAALDDARRRLFDCTHAEMGGRNDWPWHITCVRYGHSRDCAALLAAASSELALDEPWTISSASRLHTSSWGLNAKIGTLVRPRDKSSAVRPVRVTPTIAVASKSSASTRA